MKSDSDRNSMCILIPTYNRSEAIDYYLGKKLDNFRNACFDVIIYDSSPNDLTQVLVEKYMKKGYGCLKYVKYKDPEGDIYGTKKVKDALVECADQYEYVWLCGDTTILLLEEYQEELLELMQKDYDLIHIYTNNKNMDNQQDMDPKCLLGDFFWSMTHWCSFILSKWLIREMDKWYTEYIKLNITTVTVFTVFAALINRDFKIAYINHRCFENSPCRTHAMSQQNRDILRGYAEMISIGIDNLPSEYDEIKSIAKKSFNENTGLFSLYGAINLRADGNLTLRKLTKYRKYLIQVTDVPIIWFYLWSALPKRIAQKFSDINIKSGLSLQRINENGSKLILYGAGGHGDEILEKVQYIYKNIKVLAISDKNWNKLKKKYEIISPSDICKYSYDYVGVAIINSKIYKEARRELIKQGVSAKQIFHV